MGRLAGVEDVDPDGQAELTRLEVRVDAERKRDIGLCEDGRRESGVGGVAERPPGPVRIMEGGRSSDQSDVA